jgi:hypothetical protein
VGGVKMDTNNNGSILVTFPHGKKYPYLTSCCLLANALYVGIHLFFGLSIYYYIVFVLPFFPLLFISSMSSKEKHIFEVLDDSVLIGETHISYSSMKKIAFYKPITVFFHVITEHQKKKIITIQLNKNEAEKVFVLIKNCAQSKGIEFEKHY